MRRSFRLERCRRCEDVDIFPRGLAGGGGDWRTEWCPIRRSSGHSKWVLDCVFSNSPCTIIVLHDKMRMHTLKHILSAPPWAALKMAVDWEAGQNLTCSSRLLLAAPARVDLHPARPQVVSLPPYYEELTMVILVKGKEAPC